MIAWVRPKVPTPKMRAGGMGTDMRRTAFVAATVLGVVFAQTASAADLPVAPAYRPAPIVVPYNWNGYYLGANVGWSRTESSITWSPNSGGFVDAAAIAAAS